MKRFYALFLLSFYLIIYILKWKYLLFLFPLFIFLYILSTLKVAKLTPFLALYGYLTINLIYSFFHNDVNVILMDSKIYILILLFYISYILTFKEIFKLKHFSKAVYIVSILISCLGIISTMIVNRFGNRGDFGNALVLLLPLIIYFYNKGLLSIKKLVIVISINFFSLGIMKGRTALIAYMLVFFFIYFYRRKLRLNINKKLIIILGIIGFIIALQVFLFRAGPNNESLKKEARYFAYFIFVNILQNINWQNFLFGFGFGSIFDSFADKIDIAFLHVTQIKMSSGVGHYVSWGFHNNIIRVFLLFGFLGMSILYFWQISLFFIKKREKLNSKIVELKTILKILFFATLLLSFSNGIYGITLVGSLIFTLQGLIYGEINLIEKNNIKTDR